MIVGRFLLPAVLGAWLISCGPQQNREPAQAQAFVGPITLNLRQELSPKAAVSATVRHGEALDILEYKRRFLKVRTAGGIVGWADTRDLMTPDQMAELRRVAERAASYPSQGVASTFEPLNVHTEPSRSSPTFLQIAEGGKVEVIGHKVTPRTQPAPPVPAPPPKLKPQRRKSKPQKGLAKIPPPPMPVPPGVPGNWLALSQKAPAAEQPPPSPPAPPPGPVPMDDWTMIRTKDGQVGWVLSRMVVMGVPDEVAQYAEGRRIVAYFSMGDVQDGDAVKHNWLWTTVGKGPRPYEFDSFRFFIWSKRHHRYETAYIQRDVTGHYPVEVNTSGPAPVFSLILEDDDGHLVKKTYSFNGYRVNLVSAEPYQPTVARKPNAPASPGAGQGRPAQGWFAGVFGSIKDRLAHLLH